MYKLLVTMNVISAVFYYIHIILYSVIPARRIFSDAKSNHGIDDVIFKRAIMKNIMHTYIYRGVYCRPYDRCISWC